VIFKYYFMIVIKMSILKILAGNGLHCCLCLQGNETIQQKRTNQSSHFRYGVSGTISEVKTFSSCSYSTKSQKIKSFQARMHVPLGWFEFSLLQYQKRSVFRTNWTNTEHNEVKKSYYLSMLSSNHIQGYDFTPILFFHQATQFTINKNK
jgi:hypothetical protein